MSSSDPPQPAAPPLPLHAVSYDSEGRRLTAQRRGGRPRKVAIAPTASEAEYIAAVNAARDRHVDADALVGAVEGKADADDVLRAVVEGLARETASLAWEIRRGRDGGRDVAQLCSRRIDGLSKIALVQLGRTRLGLGHDLTPNDPRREAIANCFLSSIETVLASSLPTTTFENVMSKIEERLREWQRGTPE